MIDINKVLFRLQHELEEKGRVVEEIKWHSNDERNKWYEIIVEGEVCILGIDYGFVGRDINIVGNVHYIIADEERVKIPHNSKYSGDIRPTTDEAIAVVSILVNEIVKHLEARDNSIE